MSIKMTQLGILLLFSNFKAKCIYNLKHRVKGLFFFVENSKDLNLKRTIQDKSSYKYNEISERA